jgi:nicotinate-nucleotide pyrophosphorylase (carboxylating)
MDKQELRKLIAIWFEEDIRDGDHTSLSCIPPTQMGCQQLIIKDTGVLAGVEVAKEIITYFDPECRVEQYLEDGAKVKPGDVAFKVYGKELSLLQIERTMLNVMQRMSGVATTAHRYQSLIEDTGCHVLDTRKTTPGLRYLEKEAVKIGGGMNHRIGLFDMILLKDNHVDFAGGITNALTRARDYCKEKGAAEHSERFLHMKIEIEVRNFEEINEALATNIPDRIMLDNFTPAKTKEAVDIIRNYELKIKNETGQARHFEIESSGGITIDTIRDYALQGVDFVSVGALTHSYKSLDMSFKAVK